MNDFKNDPPALRESMLSAARRVIESGWYILGSEVEAFEHQWAKTCGVGYSVGVGNGMDAIEITLRSLNIGPGDEVITTTMTAFASVLAIIRAGATPVLADIDPQTALLSIESARRCITNNTKAIILVHLYGQVRDMDAWKLLCDNNDIQLIEDCAQAHLATWQGSVAGSFGRAGAYSFYPTKNLGALGDAGIIVTKDGTLAQRAEKLRNYGQSVRYHHPEIGMNSRLDEIHAAILSERIKWLPQFTEIRRRTAASYRIGIINPLITHLAEPQDQYAHVFHLYVIVCKNREALQAHLLSKGVQALIHYPIPIHQQPPCKLLLRDPLGLRASEDHSIQCLSLPCHPHMSDQDVEHVIDAVNSFKNS